MRASVPSPILPTCTLSATGIEGLYAGRFIALPFHELRQGALEAFPNDGEERLAGIIDSATSVVGEEQARAALEDFVAILSRREGLLGEEIAHHEDLVRTPLWGLLNAIAVCERLHLIAAQSLYHPRRRPSAGLRTALGHALRLHALRRYLDAQKWAVVETLFLLPSVQASPGGYWQQINDFETAYGPEAGQLAEVMWQRIEAHEDSRQALGECRDILLAALDFRWLTAGAWPSLLDRGLALLDEESRFSQLQKRALAMAGKGGPGPQPGAASPLPLTHGIAAYLVKIRCRGLFALFLRAAFNAFPRSLVPLAPRLLAADPYSEAPQDTERRRSVPALRTYLPDGRGLIIDPASVTASSRKLAHSGMENLLDADRRELSNYAVDQFILRRMVELIVDREDLWSSRLLEFIQRWTLLDEEGWRAARTVLARTEPSLRKLAVAADERGREEVSRGVYSAEMMAHHLEARELLLDVVAREHRERSHRKVIHELLHAYYMHGL